MQRVSGARAIASLAPLLSQLRRLSQLRAHAARFAAGACLLAASGCYYGHLASGQLEVLLAGESFDDVRADPKSPERLLEQLRLVERSRDFAAALGLSVGGRYTSYVDWPGDRIVTSVIATRPGEVDAAGFEFPLIGTVPYKGFFDLAAAEDEANALRSEGMDVCVVPVPAYSTLGFLDDPITAPMLQRSDDRLVETVVHELVHATVFVASEPEFNEGVARFVGQEAAVRFYASDGSANDGSASAETADPSAAQRVRERVEDDRSIADALLAFRDEIAALYAGEPDPARRASEREQRELAFRARLARLPLHSNDADAIAGRARLNDACLAISSTYAADTDRHVAVLDALDGDLRAFVDALRRAAESDDPRAEFFARAGAPAAAAADDDAAVMRAPPAAAAARPDAPAP